jgi:hypothetical protein
MVGNRRLTAGSMILAFSASHLGNVELTAYVEDHMEACRRVKER